MGQWGVDILRFLVLILYSIRDTSVDTESMIKELFTCHIRLTPASSNLFDMGHHGVSTGL